MEMLRWQQWDHSQGEVKARSTGSKDQSTMIDAAMIGVLLIHDKRSKTNAAD